jgi:hypothetical protein
MKGKLDIVKDKPLKVKKRGRPPKYDWEQIEPLMLLMARMGFYEPVQLARVLDIPRGTIIRHLKDNKEFKKKLKTEFMRWGGKLWVKIAKQVENDNWNAIQYASEKFLNKLDKIMEDDKQDESKVINITFGVKESKN